MFPGCSDHDSDVFQGQNSMDSQEIGPWDLSKTVENRQCGQSNVKCSPKTIQETTREFNFESRLPKSESSAFTPTPSFL